MQRNTKKSKPSLLPRRWRALGCFATFQGSSLSTCMVSTCHGGRKGRGARAVGGIHLLIKALYQPNCWWGHIFAGIYQHQILGVSVYFAQSGANRRCDVHAASICEQAEQGLWKDPRTPLKRSEVRSREGFWQPEKTPGSKHPCRDRRDPRCGMPSLPPSNPQVGLLFAWSP